MRKMLFLSCLFFASCGLFDGTDLEASFIHFTRPSLITNGDEGANTHNITDLWIEMDGLNMGVNEIPGTIPFLPTTEEPFVIINAGIRPNGIQANAVTYPMYDFLQPDFDFVPGVTDTVALSFRYKDEVKFPLVEGFEGTQIFTRDEDDDADSFVEIISGDVGSGMNAARMTVTEDHPELKVSSLLDLTDIPDNGTSVYVELDYKNDITFVVGLIGSSNGIDVEFPKIFIPPRDNWNKIYIDFTQDIVESGFESYRVLFVVVKEIGADDGNVLIDNVKLLHF